jgi:hypothetical protein
VAQRVIKNFGLRGDRKIAYKKANNKSQPRGQKRTKEHGHNKQTTTNLVYGAEQLSLNIYEYILSRGHFKSVGNMSSAAGLSEHIVAEEVRSTLEAAAKAGTIEYVLAQ